MTTRTASGTVILSSTTNTAGSTTNSSSINNTTGIGGSITWQITNGATAPTTACAAILQVSIDNSTWVYGGQQQTAGLTASTTYSGVLEAYDFLYYRVSFSGNTGQSVTVIAQSHQTTAY